MIHFDNIKGERGPSLWACLLDWHVSQLITLNKNDTKMSAFRHDIIFKGS